MGRGPRAKAPTVRPRRRRRHLDGRRLRRRLLPHRPRRRGPRERRRQPTRLRVRPRRTRAPDLVPHHRAGFGEAMQPAQDAAASRSSRSTSPAPAGPDVEAGEDRQRDLELEGGIDGRVVGGLPFGGHVVDAGGHPGRVAVVGPRPVVRRRDRLRQHARRALGRNRGGGDGVFGAEGTRIQTSDETVAVMVNFEPLGKTEGSMDWDSRWITW